MKQIIHKLWNYSPAQVFAILRNKLSAPDFVPEPKIDPSELERLRRLPRFTEGNSVFLDKRLDFIDASSYLSMLDEIFVKQNYGFATSKNDPYIIDCGSNIGLSIIFFKSIFPSARVVGFEPGKKQFSALEKNMRNFGYNDVKIFNKAVWDSEESVNFKDDGSWGGKAGAVAEEFSVRVESKRLRYMLDEKVDFLKIDIEGAETRVLRDCAENLKNVDNLFIEYHSTAGEEQTLDEILSIIKKASMRYHVKEAAMRKNPFLNKISTGFDSQLDIFAYRA